jgi:drug/metabolite transporter (DMT)-like permease
MIGVASSGIGAALTAAVLFGAGTPLAKVLLAHTSPLLLAALLYLGSGIGLLVLRRIRRAPAARLAAGEWKWLVGAVVCGGAVGPVLLMAGLSAMPASGAALLLNAEGVFTALLAWFAFKENFDRRIALGMFAILTGAVVLSWPANNMIDLSGLRPTLAVLGACLAWGIDNNLTRKVSLTDASWIAAVKGLSAGIVNLGLATAVGETLPAPLVVAGAMVVGFLAHGVSLALFVVGLRQLGTARTGAYFSVAPFVGAGLALIGGEPITLRLVAAGLLMGLGIWLHLTERHEHVHVHEVMEHEHPHEHDVHHQHGHPDQPGLPLGNGAMHSHRHRHESMEHAHAHFPDAHHRHVH